MSDITSLLGEATTLFLQFTVLAITCVGFFIGRKWFRNVDSGGSKADMVGTDSPVAVEYNPDNLPEK